jgi:hypothetical protein
MSADPWLTEMYFDWLVSEAFSSRVNRREYEGCLRQLHDIPFLWTLLSDENRSGDALTFRQSEFLGYQTDLESLDQVWLGIWATATPSVLEVLLGVARRYSFYFGGDVAYYFGHLFRNMEYDRYPGRVLGPGSVNSLRERTMTWITRQFEPNGKGSPFPITNEEVLREVDLRMVDVWGQMNAYSAEHFQ